MIRFVRPRPKAESAQATGLEEALLPDQDDGLVVRESRRGRDTLEDAQETPTSRRAAPTSSPTSSAPAAQTGATVPSDPGAYFGMFEGLPCPESLASARFVFQITSDVELCWLMASEQGECSCGVFLSPLLTRVAVAQPTKS